MSVFYCENLLPKSKRNVEVRKHGTCSMQNSILNDPSVGQLRFDGSKSSTLLGSELSLSPQVTPEVRNRWFKVDTSSDLPEKRKPPYELTLKVPRPQHQGTRSHHGQLTRDKPGYPHVEGLVYLGRTDAPSFYSASVKWWFSARAKWEGKQQSLDNHLKTLSRKRPWQM